MSSLLQLSRS